MMSNKRHKSYKLSLSRLAAGVASMAMLATSGLGLAFAAGEGDHNDGTGGAAVATRVMWWYKDDASGSWGSATDPQSVANAFNSDGITIQSTAWNTVRDTLARANSKCVEGFHQRHPGEGDGECRVVGVGAATYANTRSYDEHIQYDRNVFQQGWDTLIKPYKYNYGGTREYNTSTPFDDDPSRSVDSIVHDQLFSGGENKNLVVIVLDKYQPAPRTYDLRVSTKAAAPANMQVGDTSAVHDTITTSTDPSNAPAESVSADVILHYDLPQGSYVKAHAPVTKRVTLPSRGTTQSPDFTPADFGWTYWPEGSGWFDIRVSKQGKMKQAVDTADRDPAETFRVTATPPASPVKTVEKGVSADSMTNRTRISTGTGVGGYELTIVDTINPNGVNYTVSNITVTDTTTGADITGECTSGWDRSANTVSAHRSSEHGLLPANHTVELAFDVTVSQPTDYKAVQDTGTVAWNHNPAVSTNPGEFPTWQPNPDKAWVKWDTATEKWRAVVDPERTNGVGADGLTFLDGDRVGAVVNGLVSAHLIEAPEKLVLSDDYSKAAYIWTPDEQSAVRVYVADNESDRVTGVDDIARTGVDVTDKFTIQVDKTAHLVTARSVETEFLSSLKGLAKNKQLTLLIPGTIRYAAGEGAKRVLKDFGKAAGEELTFCAAPSDGNPAERTLTNKGAQRVNEHEVATNEPNICGYIPPVKKDVLSEASQGGDQESVDGKVVFPGQKVEYRLETQPQLPDNLGYTVEQVVITDTFDQYLTPDKQTVEVTDLATARMISKKQYKTAWNDEAHQFTLTFDAAYVAKHWANGQNPRLLVRFEGTVSKDAPAKRTVDNKWELTLNNSITPSNVVVNTPPEQNPHKADKSVKDASVSIDGKTLLVGERGLYQLTLDAHQADTAYKVWRLGMTDDFDERYVKINPQDITVMSDTGKDVTDQLNIQIKDGVAYVFAKTVDTEVPATGETVKGDPQPADLKAYAESNAYDPLTMPAIDQALLGHIYTINLPYEVIAGGKGTVVENTAVQITNDVKKQTETVANPVEEINPKKDVTVKVGGESVDAKAVYLDSNFLYQLDSSVLPPNRAYPEVSQWGIDDQLDPAYDLLSGQWAVYAARDLYKDGKQIAAQGEKIAGSNFDSTKFGGDLFTGELDPKTGKVVIAATDLYLSLVSADTAHEQAWRSYIQVKRVKTTEHHENQFVEHVGDKDLTSNIVWTYTPDLTPSLHVEKYDVQTGEVLGDRDDVKDALQIHGESLEIAFKITNTSKTDSKTGKGAYFAAKSLKLDDQTIAGVGKVENLRYPEEWDSLVLAPGESTIVTGTLKGVNAGDKHTDRVKVTGTPLVECPVSDEHPFDNADSGQTSGNESIDADRVTVQLDGKDVTLCKSTDVESNTDDWSGYKQTLAQTGAQIASLMLIATVGLLLGGFGMFAVRRRNRARHIA